MNSRLRSPACCSKLKRRWLKCGRKRPPAARRLRRAIEPARQIMPRRSCWTKIALIGLFFIGSPRAMFGADGAAEKQPATVSLIMVGDIMVAQDEETGKVIERGGDPFEPFSK